MPDASRTRKQRAATRAKVKAHRAKLRAQGLRPIQVWIPDTRAPRIARELRRQCRLIAAHPREADDQAFVDSIAWVVGDGAR